MRKLCGPLLLRWICGACAAALEEGRCPHCGVRPSANSSAISGRIPPDLFDVSARAEVDDGTGVAMIDVRGRLVWHLLDASEAVVRAVRDICLAHGPLRLQNADHEWGVCLSRRRGVWHRGGGWLAMPGAARRLLDDAVAGSRRQRSFICLCRVTRVPPPSTWQALLLFLRRSAAVVVIAVHVAGAIVPSRARRSACEDAPRGRPAHAAGTTTARHNKDAAAQPHGGCTITTAAYAWQALHLHAMHARMELRRETNA